VAVFGERLVYRELRTPADVEAQLGCRTPYMTTIHTSGPEQVKARIRTLTVGAHPSVNMTPFLGSEDVIVHMHERKVQSIHTVTDKGELIEEKI
jgi:hypothetical protein